jgi:hypothetical protein
MQNRHFIKAGRSKQLFSSAAVAAKTDAGENAFPAPVDVDHAVVAVDVDARGKDEKEENENRQPEENKGKKRQAAVAMAAAFFDMKPAVRAVADCIRHLGFAFRTFGERHGYSSCTPPNSAK